ncbi:MAG: hypothetical protein Kow0037_31870 [Calditrichia bacterium]
MAVEIKDWYYWPCQSYSGALNMALDDWASRHILKELDRPLLRFFTWTPECISLGYHQKESELNLELCRNDGVDVVRRPTGGRAILHARELTYSVVYPFQSLNVETFYRDIHLPFVKALQQMGVPAEFQAAQADFRKFYQTDRSAVCFATSAKYEVEIERKKLIGSAQRVYEKSILQHGSLLLGQRHRDLVNYLKLPENARQRVLRHVDEHTAHVWQYNREVDAVNLAERVKSAFEAEFGIRFTPIDEAPELKAKMLAKADRDAFRIQSAGKKFEEEGAPVSG